MKWLYYYIQGFIQYRKYVEFFNIKRNKLKLINRGARTFADVKILEFKNKKRYQQ